jgi:tRNA 2-thiouridine synthesizing protein A
LALILLFVPVKDSAAMKLAPETPRRWTMTTTDLATLKAAAVVDARGSACPGPLMEAKKAIGKVKVGEVLEVLSNDPGTKDDMSLWAKKVGHEPLGFLGADGYDRIFIIRKK